MRHWTVAFGLFALCTPVLAQGIEGVILERFHAEPNATDGSVLVTYRVHLDLAAGYQLQLVYGDDAHNLRFASTSEFLNTTNSVRYGDRITEVPSEVAERDSWFTLGMVGSDHWGVPRELDTDGSLNQKKRKDPVRTDGLMPASSSREVVNFNFLPGYLGDIRGNIIETNNGGWAVLGGMKGATEDNTILIAQLTTAGELSFEINVQLAAPDGSIEKYVARNAREGEIIFAPLCQGGTCTPRH